MTINHEDDEPIANIQAPRTEEEDPDKGMREADGPEKTGNAIGEN